MRELRVVGNATYRIYSCDESFQHAGLSLPRPLDTNAPSSVLVHTPPGQAFIPTSLPLWLLNLESAGFTEQVPTHPVALPMPAAEKQGTAPDSETRRSSASVRTLPSSLPLPLVYLESSELSASTWARFSTYRAHSMSASKGGRTASTGH